MIVKKDCPMGEYTSFRTGKNAKYLLIPETEAEITEAINFAKKEGLDYLILGNGTNVLFAGNYEGVVIKLNSENISKIAKDAAKTGLAGLEFASGIPGSLGGAVVMNAGAYGGEMSKVLKTVTSIDENGKLHVRKADECDFGYRHSIFMENHEVVIAADFELYHDDPEKIEERIAELTKQRVEKQPLSYPSAGSFFKRPEGNFAGKLIEDSGLKGLQVGGAQVSDLHAGFIINKDNASPEDIIDLMKLVQETVYDKFGVMLEPEVKIIGL